MMLRGGRERRHTRLGRIFGPSRGSTCGHARISQAVSLRTGEPFRTDTRVPFRYIIIERSPRRKEADADGN